MRRIRLTSFTLLILGAFASHASAFDLTGHWTGTRKCQDLFGGTKEKFTDTGTAQITQVGNLIGIVFTFFGSPVSDTGLANFSALKPDKGEFAMIHCGTNDVVGDQPTFDSIGRMQASTKANQVKAKIKGLSIFSDNGTASPGLGTCKWSFTRTDTVNPGVPTTCN